MQRNITFSRQDWVHSQNCVVKWLCLTTETGELDTSAMPRSWWRMATSSTMSVAMVFDASRGRQC